MMTVFAPPQATPSPTRMNENSPICDTLAGLRSHRDRGD